MRPESSTMISFGPIPSRRLGSSLGINHIPPKHCSYACIYCQAGKTTHMEIKRQKFYPVDRILCDVEKKISQCSTAGVKIDYLTLVPDGEPTLDINLGKLITELKKFNIPVAVISNGCLMDDAGVQEELLQADWVSLKVDSVDEYLWRKVNRPHRQLSLPKILEGMLAFRKKYKNELVTETMLISGLNDDQAAIQPLCDFLLELQPEKSYLSFPIRPPVEHGVTAPSAEALLKIMQILSPKIPFIELLIETEIGNFISTGNVREDILSITAVHPLREEVLREMLNQAGERWHIVESLLEMNDLCCVYYRNERFFIRSTQTQYPRKED